MLLYFSRNTGAASACSVLPWLTFSTTTLTAPWRSGLFGLIRSTPSLDWLLLTKRPQNIIGMLPRDWRERQYLNVWLGITAENQHFFDQRWPVLASVPAAIRFVSYEPALGALRLRDDVVQPDWLISGGESGSGARPLNPLWIRDIITDCERLGVASFHKQWGMYRNNPLCCEDGRSPCEAKALDVYGKGGALVNGKLYRRFPNLSWREQRSHFPQTNPQP